MGLKSWFWIIGVATAMAALPAVAQPWGGGQGGGQRGQRFDPDRPMPSADQTMRPREFRQEEPMPGPGRMSPEERRQLRRDIQSAGEDLYRRPMPERPHRRF